MSASFADRVLVGLASAARRLGLSRVLFSAPVRRVARWLRPQPRGPVWRTVVSGRAAGADLQILPNTPMAYWTGMHEPDMQEWLARHIRPGMVVYDCGANVGLMTIVMARAVGPAGRVFAFEPSPENFACLRAAVEKNTLTRVTPVAEAVWDRIGHVQFQVAAPGSGTPMDQVQGRFDNSAQAATVEVPAVSLDEFVYGRGNPAPDILKIDVEGAEGHALAGAERLLAEKRPTLLLEIHGGPGRAAWDVLLRHGYESRDLTTGAVPASVDEFAVWIRQFVARPREA